MRRLLGGASFLFAGQMVSYGCVFLCYLIVARSLSADDFGCFAIAVTSAQVVDRLLNFQTWEACIKYLSLSNNNRYRCLVFKYCLVLDLSSALLSAIVFLGVIYLVAASLDWDESKLYASYFFAFSIALNVVGGATGVIRFYDKYKLQSLLMAVVSVFKLFWIFEISVSDGQPVDFIVAWVVTDAAYAIAIFALGLWVFYDGYKQNKTDFQAGDGGYSVTSVDFFSVLKFASITNFSSGLRVISREIDTVLVGVVVGEVAAGFVKIVKQISGVISKPTDALYQVMYPEFRKNIATGNFGSALWTLSRLYVMLGGGGIACFFLMLFLAEDVLALFYGEDYLAAALALKIYMAAQFLCVLSLPNHPLLVASGYALSSLKVLFISTVAYLIFLPFLLNFYGVEGTSLAYLLFYVIWSLLTSIMVFELISGRRRVVLNEKQ